MMPWMCRPKRATPKSGRARLLIKLATSLLLAISALMDFEGSTTAVRFTISLTTFTMCRIRIHCVAGAAWPGISCHKHIILSMYCMLACMCNYVFISMYLLSLKSTKVSSDLRVTVFVQGSFNFGPWFPVGSNTSRPTRGGTLPKDRVHLAVPRLKGRECAMR